jgi:hypothetical protein
MPTRLDQLFPSDKPPVTKAVKRTARQAPPPMYMLEVIQGTKRSEEKFQE